MVTQIDVYKKILELRYIKYPENFVYDYRIDKISNLFFIYVTLKHKHMINDWELREVIRTYISDLAKFAGIRPNQVVVVYDWVSF